MTFTVIYDGLCNLCAGLVQLLETVDRGNLFRYIPMQDQERLQDYGITAQDCELGMILIDDANPEQRWQGSAAAEEIGRLLPLGQELVAVYRGLPGVKSTGDQLYTQIRDNRYTLFGKRDQVYQSIYPACPTSACPFPGRADGE